MMETGDAQRATAGRGNWLAITLLFQSWRSRQQVWFDTAIVFVGLLIICLGLPLVDERLLFGVSVWSKPIKFCLSFVVFFGSLAWFAGLLKPAAVATVTATQAGNDKRTPGAVLVWVPVVAAVFEIGYIIAQASQGQTSHFNYDSTYTSFMYGLMGFGAVLLVGSALWLGCKILARHGLHDPYVMAVGLGLVLTFFLGGGLGMFLSNSHGHWVGGTPNDALGLPLFNWSMDGGDLRVAHFFGLHAMQALPLFVFLLPQALARSVRWALVVCFGCAYSAWTLVTFVQALNAQPLIGA